MSLAVVRVEAAADLEACLALRTEVFVGEQGVSPADEIDGRDGSAMHLLARWEGIPAGTLRLRAVGDAGKIERVCVAARFRGRGIADALTRAALDEIATWPEMRRAKLSAQTQVIGFYARHGFVARGPVYDDAGIPHRDMSRPL